MIAAVSSLGFCAILAAVRTVLAARHVGAAIGDSGECASRQGEGEGKAALMSLNLVMIFSENYV
ncbi:MAG: hypothetical protein EOP64_03020 [Sphingomonas sp.]|nr:MAG: hypothetical protein EOP64_03020 [Sphingomonas sp.]